LVRSRGSSRKATNIVATHGWPGHDTRSTTIGGGTSDAAEDGMRPSVLAVFLVGCAMNHDLDGLTPHEQALLGCWQGLQGSSNVHYRFNTDRTVDSFVANGRTVQGTFTAGTGMMHLDFGEPVSHRIYLTPTAITYVDLPGELDRQTCD
jgi:hypothetical protein